MEKSTTQETSSFFLYGRHAMHPHEPVTEKGKEIETRFLLTHRFGNETGHATRAKVEG